MTATKTKRKPAKKAAKKAAKARKTKAIVATIPFALTKGHALVLRTCNPDLSSHNGFVWPASGPVACKDWKPVPECGNGLHGLAWGEGDGSVLNWSPNAKWLVVSVPEESLVEIDRKVKFPRGEVVHCGDRKSATDFMIAQLCRAASVVGCTLTGGNESTLTGGDRSTLTGGYGSTLTGGYGSTLQFRFWRGDYRRVVTIYVGEDGIEPNEKYTLNSEYKPTKVTR